MISSDKIEKYIDYYLPREVMGPVIVVFSVENIIDILFNQYAPAGGGIAGWTVVFVLSVTIVAWWGEADEDSKEDFEEALED